MIWLDVDNLAVLVLATAFASLGLSLLTTKAGPIMYRCQQLASAYFCLYVFNEFGFYEDVFGYALCAIAPMLIFTFIERLYPEYFFEGTAIRIGMLLVGIYYMSFYDEIYSTTSIQMMQYVCIFILQISITNDIIGFDREYDMRSPVREWVFKNIQTINLIQSVCFLSFSLIGTAYGYFLMDPYFPPTMGYLSCTFVACLAVLCAVWADDPVDDTNIQCQLFLIGMGLYYLVSGWLEGNVNVTGVVLLLTPFVYMIIYMIFKGTVLVYIPWLIILGVMLILAATGFFTVYIYTALWDYVGFQGVYDIVYCIPFAITTALISLNMCTVTTPANLLWSIDECSEGCSDC